MLGIKRTYDLGKYLGVPLLHKRINKTMFHELVDNVSRKVRKWQLNRISLAGRLMFCKSMIPLMPIYLMQSMGIPKGICDNLGKIGRKFL